MNISSVVLHSKHFLLQSDYFILHFLASCLCHTPVPVAVRLNTALSEEMLLNYKTSLAI